MRAMRQRFVYVLRNADNPPRYYTGLTSDVARRHAEHNAGSCTHTAKYRPWTIDVVIEFVEERRAVAFERYLKSGSGVTFAHRHLRYSPRRMPVSRAAMIIDRRCGDATASRAVSSASLTRRRRVLSSSSIRISTSVPRRKGVRSRYSRPTA